MSVVTGEYIIGRCHKGPCDLKGELFQFLQRRVYYPESSHWHYWRVNAMDASMLEASTFATYEDAENKLAEILILHPDWTEEVSIETMGAILFFGRGEP